MRAGSFPAGLRNIASLAYDKSHLNDRNDRMTVGQLIEQLNRFDRNAIVRMDVGGEHQPVVNRIGAGPGGVILIGEDVIGARYVRPLKI